MSNLVFLIHTILDVLGKTQPGIFPIWISGKSLINKNCHSFRISNDIDMNFGPVAKLEHGDYQKFDDVVLSANYDIKK